MRFIPRDQIDMELSQLQLSESKQQSHQSALREGKQRRSNIEHLSLHLTYDDREFEQLEAIPFALRTPYLAQFWQLVSGNNRHLIEFMISPRLE